MSTSVASRPAQLLVSARDELASLDQWVVSKLVEGRDRDGNLKYDKPPLKLNRAGDKLIGASHSEPRDWTTYAAAWDVVRHQIDGAQAVGFVFHETDPYTGIDFDGCRDPETGAIETWAQIWIDRLNSYTEISQSGNGVKVWVRGKLPKAIIHKLGAHKGIEIYSCRRYFWMTFSRVSGTPATINEAQAVLDEMVRTLKPEKPKSEPRRTERKITPGEQAAEDMALTERYALARAYILDSFDLVTELKAAGAEKTRDGYTCPFCKHTHETTLTIEPGGKVGFSLSPGCKLSSAHGFDVTNVLLLKDGYRGFDALARALAPHCFPQPKPKDDRETPHYLTPEEQTQRRAEAQRKRATRAAEQAQRRAAQAEQTARIAEDGVACDTHRTAWTIHCKYFGTVAQHPTSVPRMAADLCGVEVAEESHVRKMQRANDWLIEHGYLVRIARTARRDDGKQHTNLYQPAPLDAIRVTRDVVAQQDAENAARDTLVDHEHVFLENHDHACERGADPQPDRELLSQVWALAAQVGDGALLVDYDALDDEALAGFVELLAAELAERAAAEMHPENFQDTPPAASGELRQIDQVADGASYDPAADWTVSRRRRPATPPKLAALEAKRRRTERYRTMDTPELRAQFYKLRNKARRTTNPQQRLAIEGQLAEMEHWLALKDAARPEPVEGWAVEQSPASRSRPGGRAAPPSQATPTTRPPPALGSDAALGPLFAGAP